MAKSTRATINIITILGGILVLTGLVGPWVSFSVVDQTVGNYWSFKMSPFYLTVEVSSIKDPFKEVTSFGRHYFHRVDSSLIGVICILGAILSFFGGSMDRRRLSLVGGVMVLLSTISFPICLPGYLPGLYVEWAGIVSVVGGIVIIFSVRLGSVKNFFRHKLFSSRFGQILDTLYIITGASINYHAVLDNKKVIDIQVSSLSLGKINVSVRLPYGSDRVSSDYSIINIDGKNMVPSKTGLYLCSIKNWSPVAKFRIEIRRETENIIINKKVISFGNIFLIIAFIIIFYIFYIYNKNLLTFNVKL